MAINSDGAGDLSRFFQSVPSYLYLPLPFSSPYPLLLSWIVNSFQIYQQELLRPRGGRCQVFLSTDTAQELKARNSETTSGYKPQFWALEKPFPQHPRIKSMRKEKKKRNKRQKNTHLSKAVAGDNVDVTWEKNHGYDSHKVTEHL